MRCVNHPLDFLDLTWARGLAGIHISYHCSGIALLRRGKSHCVVLVSIFSTLIRIRKKRLVNAVPISFSPFVKTGLLLLLQSKSFHADLSWRGARHEADIAWTVRGRATPKLVSVQHWDVPETSRCLQGCLIISLMWVFIHFIIILMSSYSFFLYSILNPAE